MKRQSAFTLIELLVVIAIIALLVSILMPSLQKAKELAKNVVCMSNAKSINTAFMLYANDYDDYIPFTRNALDPRYPALTWAIRIGKIADDYYILPYNMRFADSGYLDAHKIALNGYMEYRYASDDKGFFKCPAFVDQVNPKYEDDGGCECNYSINRNLSPGAAFQDAADRKVVPTRITDIRGGAVLFGGGNLNPAGSWIRVVYAYDVVSDGSLRTSPAEQEPGTFFGPWTHQVYIGKWTRTFPCDFAGHPGGAANLSYTDGHTESVKNIKVDEWKIR